MEGHLVYTDGKSTASERYFLGESGASMSANLLRDCTGVVGACARARLTTQALKGTSTFLRDKSCDSSVV